MNLETYKRELGIISAKERLSDADYAILINRFEHLVDDINLAVVNNINPAPYQEKLDKMIESLTQEKND